MLLELAFLFGSVLMAQSSTITHAVTDYQCGKTFTIDEEQNFIYNGGYLAFPCVLNLKLSSSDTMDDICVSAITLDTSCRVRLEYHDYLIGSSPDGEVDCYSTNPTEEHCTIGSNLYVVFDNMNNGNSMTGVNIMFKAYRKSNNIIEDVQKAVSITIGVIVGILVLVGIASVVVIVICCNRRRRSAAGMVYNQTQMQNTTVQQVPYPYPAQPVPQQQYYPPGPQPMGYGQPMGPQPVTGNPPAPGAYGTGYQGPQPMGYGQPMGPQPVAGNPPAPYGTGYQGPPAYSQPEKTASAPAMTNDFETQPPPYPGN